MAWSPISIWRPIAGTGQNVTFSGTSAQSSAFTDTQQAVQISATANCHVAVGANPTATTKDMLIKASDPPYIIRIQAGEMIAVIQDTAGGTLNIVAVTH
jgi:5-deoxy-D-glucuronate isomerase